MAETVSDINGGSNHYATLILWETDKDGDITAGNAEVAEVYGDLTIDDNVCNLAGWTTDADSYIAVRIAPSLARTSSDPLRAGQVVTLTSNRNGGFRSVILAGAGAEFVRVNGLDCIVDSGSSSRAAINFNFGASTTEADGKISNCVATQVGGSVSNGTEVTESDDSVVHVVTIWNTVMYNCVHGHYSSNNGSSQIIYLYNCTSNGNSGGGFYPRYGDGYTYNCIAYNNTSSDFASVDGGDYNMSEDATAPGGNSIVSGAGTPDFVNTGAGTEDFHLQATSDAIDTGQGNADGGGEPSATFSVDIDGVTYGPADADWDMGVSEFVAAGGLSIPVAMHHYLRH